MYGHVMDASCPGFCWSALCCVCSQGNGITLFHTAFDRAFSGVQQTVAVPLTEVRVCLVKKNYKIYLDYYLVHIMLYISGIFFINLLLWRS